MLLLTFLSVAAAGECHSGQGLYYRDYDGDRYGTSAVARMYCRSMVPPGWVAAAGDCDDRSSAVAPGAVELCNGIDDDCDGEVDDDPVDGAWWFGDVDEDGLGDDADAWYGCTPPEGYVEAGGDCDDAEPAIGEVCEPALTYAVAWGDLHAHSNLSFDGCEDEDDQCLARGSIPGEDLFAGARAFGLDFAAITDHAEYSTYRRPADGTSIDVWDEQQALAQDADGGDLVPLVGYEYTALYGHRTVLFDTTTVCSEYRKAASGFRSASKGSLGLEVYLANTGSGYTDSAAMVDGLEAARSEPACVGTDVISYFHHPAYSTPAMVRWSETTNQIASDTVVEIASEHGSSECADLLSDGCDWRVNEHYTTDGSVQTALGLGLKLGFVGGTDGHDARPGSLWDGPSAVGQWVDTDGDGVPDSPRQQFANGAVTGVILDDRADLSREAIFTAIRARHTFAASWTPKHVVVYAWRTSDGTVALPGDGVPEGTWSLVVDLEDASVDSWYAEVVDPVTGDADPSPTFELASGDVRYVRIRAWIGGEEHRLWASPFFAG